MRQQGINGLRGVHAGSCHAWPLPADATCATVARQVFREAVGEVGLERDLLDDCILMASELAANTLHARAVAGTGGGGNRFVSVAPDMGGEPISSAGPAPHNPHNPQDPAVLPPAPQGCPELWLYLRGKAVWFAPGWWTSPGCARTRSRPTSPPPPGPASASAPVRRPGNSRRCSTSGGSEAGW